MTPPKEGLRLFSNPYAFRRYKYARPYAREPGDTGASGNLTDDGVTYTRVNVLGVPDGVHANAREALVRSDAIYRLYIFSDRPLSEAQLSALDGVYGREPFPVLEATRPVGSVARGLYPRVNFYLTEDARPSTLSRYIEYRYLQQRHEVARIVCDDAGLVYRLLLPEGAARLVLVMPDNFVRTDRRSGYFSFKRNLIVRIYSRFELSAANVDDADEGLVSDISTKNARLLAVVRTFFARLGLHRVHVPSENQVYAGDRYLTAVVGSLANIPLRRNKSR